VDGGNAVVFAVRCAAANHRVLRSAQVSPYCVPAEVYLSVGPPVEKSSEE